MTQTKQCNNDELDNESFVFEECQSCGKDMLDTKYIWVGTEDDLYYCQNCKITYEINASRCREL